jgi:hypothetical protein
MKWFFAPSGQIFSILISACLRCSVYNYFQREIHESMERKFSVSIHSYGGPSAGRAGRRASDERGFLSLRIEQSESDLTPTGLAQLLRRPLLYM